MQVGFRGLLLWPVIVVAFLLLIVGSSGTEAQEESPAASEEARLLDRLQGERARVHRDDETGEVTLIGAPAGGAIELPESTARATRDAASPERAARAHLDRYGQLFGIRDEARELRAQEPEPAGRSRSLVRFQQVHRGVPVLGGELNVQVDPSGDLLVANGEVLPEVPVDVAPRVTAQRARSEAVGKVAKDYGVEAGGLRATEPELWIYDPTLLGGPGARVPRLVWRTEVADAAEDARHDINELVLVDAREGGVALNFSQIAHAQRRFVCDRNNVAGASEDCLSPEDGYARTEGQPDTGNPDVDLAYDYAGDTYDFYMTNHGRDSLDGKGMALRSTVRYCPEAKECPYKNAYWNHKQMVYGDGLAGADDVVGHELTHGVTQFESNLYYYYQSGAINESLSDVWGEFVDLTNGKGNDSDEVRWLIGEDLPPGMFSPGGELRDMKDPTESPRAQPDRMQSLIYFAGEGDQGGVHSNSGVNNKAVYLMTDGDTFNGRTIRGIGIGKVARIYYEVQTNLLTSGSDYQNLYAAVQQACTTLTGTAAGITSTDCGQVKKALDATEMSLQPKTAPAPEAPVCRTGQAPRNLFSDDMENRTSGNWAGRSTVGDARWGYDSGYAASGKYAQEAGPPAGRSDYSTAKKSAVRVPRGKATFLHFKHSYDFENAGSRYFDGGVLEYSTDNGRTWADLGDKFTHNGYDGTISGSYGNPLAGRRALVGVSRGYNSSRVNLSSLAGKDVRFRFRVATDRTNKSWGWSVDDVRVYTCA